MTVQRLLDTLAGTGAMLWVENGRLRYRAPVGVLTAELRAVAAEHRGELVELLEAEADGGLPARIGAWPEELRSLWVERTGIMEFEGGLVREIAEREAEGCVRAEWASRPGCASRVDPCAVAVAIDGSRGGPLR